MKDDGMLGVQLLYFWAPWCVPCRTFGPRLERVAEEFEFPIVKINADEHDDMIREYQIMSIPTVVVISEGEVVAFLAGAMTDAQLNTAFSAVKNA